MSENLSFRVTELEEALRPFLQKIDLRTVVNLPPQTRVVPKLLTAGDYQAAAKAINIGLLPTAQREQVIK